MDKKEKVINVLNDFFNMCDTDAYWRTRCKEAFSVGTMTIEDFSEFTDETINDLADEIVKIL